MTANLAIFSRTLSHKRFEVPVGPTSTVGTQTLTLTAETFNGAPNGDSRKTATGTVVVMPFMPVTRPLIEEYTGLGCGWCPRGYIAMEEMAEKYGADFVGLAIAADGLHNDNWGQSNYYSGAEQGASDSPLWEIFLNGSHRIKDLIFNFVVVIPK